MVFWFPLSDLTHWVVIKSDKLLINQHEMAVVDRWLSDEYALTTIRTEWHINFSPFTYAHRSNTHAHTHSIGSSHRAVFFPNCALTFLSHSYASLEMCVWIIQPNFQSETMKSLNRSRWRDIHISASGQRQQFEK